MNPELVRMRSVLGSDAEVYRSLHTQFDSIFHRLTSIFTLSGITITGAAFAGYRIVQAGHFSTWALVIGLVFALSSIGTSLFAISKVRWLSSYPGSLDESFNAIIEMRDAKTRLLIMSLKLLSLGLLSYVIAICNYLVVTSLGTGMVQ